ncbi:hypothetical protein E4U42_003417 [Claviceps africana]|uniref:Uncharacterized protein n=1 Tax=Claviceps africana TaxID=83212 RepID=A0A8K0J7Y4_9HYPO|nr:hypothetical protein E4U42_003417 [Claviceps africana]
MPNGYSYENSNSEGKRYSCRDCGSSASNSYNYSNTDGSYYYSNPNGSTYHKVGNGGSTYTAPNGTSSSSGNASGSQK